MSNTCPACGKKTLFETVTYFTISETFAGKKSIPLKTFTCETCGFSGDLTHDNDIFRKDAVAELQHKAMENILTYFSDNHYSFAGIERSLGLPQRTLTKWKSGATHPAKSAVALCKFLRLFPWLIDVADNNFDTVYAKTECVKHSMDYLNTCISSEQLCEVKSVSTGSQDYLSPHCAKNSMQEEDSSTSSYQSSGAVYYEDQGSVTIKQNV